MSNMELLLLVLAIFGGIDLAGRGMRLVLSLFPRLLSLQSTIWGLLADSFTIPAFRKKAIATRIEEVLNQTAFKLQSHFPKGWVKRAKIRWVRNSRAAQFYDGNIVLRVRPGKNPDHNLMQTLWIYFYSALFPDSQDILPDEIVSAIALAITRAGLEENHPYLLKEFDEVFLQEIVAGRQNVLDHFGDFVRLNEYGLLIGPFIREVDYAAKISRFSLDRATLLGTIKGILNHMLAFQPLFRINKPSDEWFYQNACSSYGFILVSKPPDIRPGIDAYVKRAQTNIQRGINRIYLVGRHDERDFVFSVTKALLSLRELKGLEIFPLFRDYRGEPNGICALLGLDQMLTKLHLTQRPLEPLRTELNDTVTDYVATTTDKHEKLAVIAQHDLAKITEALIVQLSDYDGAWISLAEFGAAFRMQVPEFTPERYGGRNLASVLKKLESLEFDERGAGSAKAVYVRLRTGNHSVTAHVSESGDCSEAYAKIVEIVKAYARENGFIFLGTLGHYIKVHFPDFDYRNYGASSLHDFVCRIPALECQERGEGSSKSYIRIRQ